MNLNGQGFVMPCHASLDPDLAKLREAKRLWVKEQNDLVLLWHDSVLPLRRTLR